MSSTLGQARRDNREALSFFDRNLDVPSVNPHANYVKAHTIGGHYRLFVGQCPVCVRDLEAGVVKPAALESPEPHQFVASSHSVQVCEVCDTLRISPWHIELPGTDSSTGPE